MLAIARSAEPSVDWCAVVSGRGDVRVRRYNWRYSLRRTARCQPSAASHRGWRYAAQAVSISGASSPLEVRLADLLASLSLATDLGTAFPLEKALRNALLAVGIGRELGMDDQ